MHHMHISRESCQHVRRTVTCHVMRCVLPDSTFTVTGYLMLHALPSLTSYVMLCVLQDSTFTVTRHVMLCALPNLTSYVMLCVLLCVLPVSMLTKATAAMTMTTGR